MPIPLVWALAALLLADAALASVHSHLNAGLLLTWLAGAALALYAAFHRQIDTFTQSGFGLVLKMLVLCGLGVFFALLAFVALSGYGGRAKGDEKALIVLGAGVRGLRVSEVLRRRLEGALAEMERNPGCLVVLSGGQGRGEGAPEAVVMADWLLAHGADQGRLLREEESASTEENLRFSGAMLAARGIGPEAPLALVTNAFHCYRAKAYAKKLGFTQMRSVPASMSPISLIPSYFREVLALVYMWAFKRNSL